MKQRLVICIYLHAIVAYIILRKELRIFFFFRSCIFFFFVCLNRSFVVLISNGINELQFNITAFQYTERMAFRTDAMLMKISICIVFKAFSFVLRFLLTEFNRNYVTLAFHS